MQKRKFDFGVVLYWVLIILMVVIVLTITFKAKRPEKTNNYLGYTEYTTQEGDTIWSIARGCDLPQDIRKTIFDIRSKNNLDSSIIFPGQTILIPEGR